MKVEKIKQESGFEPIVLKITIETYKDLDVVRTISNAPATIACAIRDTYDFKDEKAVEAFIESLDKALMNH